jgi:hypothetical protein
MEWYLLLVVVTLFLSGWIYFSQIKWNRRKLASRQKLVEEGFTHVFSGSGNSFIAFNIYTGLFRFGTLFSYSYIERPISYISNYEWKRTSKDDQIVTNKFFFYISDVDNYMHEIFYHDSERLAEKEWAKLQAVYKECINAQYLKIESMNRIEEYDFFLSHASEDKYNFVRPLAHALTALGLKVWYDDFSLEIGDSLRRSIDYGLGNSKYGIVVLSRSFFSKQWTQYELDALVNRSMNGDKVILPIWYNVEQQDVSHYSHNLADKVAYRTSALSIEQMAQELLKMLQRSG